MCLKPFRIPFLLLLLLISCTAPVLAQAVFSVASGARAAADIGYAEQAGSISLVVTSGRTVAAPFIFTYSSTIANRAVSEISVTGTGGLVGIAAHPSLYGQSSIMINVPEGGTGGDSILISGVRIAIAGTGITKVSVNITSPTPTTNLIEARQADPVVIGSVMNPISVTQGDPMLSYAFGESDDNTSYVDVSETFPAAFTDSVGVAGQTTPVKIRITPFPALAQGAKVTFASTATASTGAKFTTLSGNDETVPRADGTTDVVFQFTSVSDSEAIVESFRFNVRLTQIPAAASGVIQFQAMLLPVGAKSADTPRYEERLVPDESDLPTGLTELVFPFRVKQENTYTGIALTNPQDFQVKTTLTAYSSDGSLITGKNVVNPATVILPRKGQYAKLASEIFGDGFNESSSGTIRAVADSSDVQGFYIISDNPPGPKFDGSNAAIGSSLAFYMPVVFREGSNSFNLLETYNPEDSESDVDFDLLNASGQVVATGSQKLAPGGMLLQDARGLFGIDLNSFEGGYIKAHSESPFVLRNNFGNILESNVLSAQLPASAQTFYVPHFASGGQYSTDIYLVNSSSYRPSTITLALLDNDGKQISTPGNPATVTLNPGSQVNRKIADLFPNLGPDLMSGSIKVDVGPHSPFGSPGVVGAIRFSAADGSASAALPIVPDLSTDCIYSHVAEGIGYYTGVVVQNPNDQAAGFSVDVYAKDGSLVGSYTSSLQPYAKIASLISQLVPAAAGQVGGYFRITSDGRLGTLALFGTVDVRSLSAIAPQILH